MINLNENQARRDEILARFFLSDEYLGGVKGFENVPFSNLKKLRDERFLYLEEYQNEAPSIRKIYEFVEKYPFIKVGGYVVSIDRSDYRVSIDSISYKIKDNNLSDVIQFNKDFTKIRQKADEFTYNGDYCRVWWD